jgi:rubrerythrin
MMERRLYQELWKIRFDKMLQLEEQSVTDYEKLLEECKTKYKGHSLEPHLEQLIKDEKKHSLLCKELLAILERQPV